MIMVKTTDTPGVSVITPMIIAEFALGGAARNTPCHDSHATTSRQRRLGDERRGRRIGSAS